MSRERFAELRAVQSGYACGCCGRDCQPNYLWCQDCRAHLHPDLSLPPWDRTYSAVHKAPCPFEDVPQIGRATAAEGERDR